MAVTTTTVTGPIYLANLSVPTDAKIVFELSSWDKQTGEAVFVSGPFLASLDVNGDFTINLFTTDAGSNGVIYDVSVLYTDSVSSLHKRESLGKIALIGPGPFKLADLNFIDPASTNSFDLLAQVTALKDQATTDLASVAANATLAQDWANKAEDSVVANNEFSAKHYAAKAALSYDSFDDRYLGPKATDPTVDNDGNVLLTGALYFNTTSSEWKVWNGTTWIIGVASGTGLLTAANNLSDVASPPTALTNLGVSTWGKTIIGAADKNGGRNALGLDEVTRGLTSNYTVVAADNRQHMYVLNSSSITITLPNPASVGPDFSFDVSVLAGDATFTSPVGTIFGLRGAPLYSGASTKVVSNGTDWYFTSVERATTTKEGLIVSATAGNLTAGVAETWPDSAVLRSHIDYVTDFRSTFLQARIDGTGTINWSYGLTSVTKTGTGIYVLNFPARTSAAYVPTCIHIGTGEINFVCPVIANNYCEIRLLTGGSGPVLTDQPFLVTLTGPK